MLNSRYVGLLAENGRLNKLEGIANHFASIMSAHRGEVRCHVTTAKVLRLTYCPLHISVSWLTLVNFVVFVQALDGPLQQELEAALKSFVKSGQSILITSNVDPSIVGGLIVSIGDKYCDMSSASKIKKYSEIIQAAV